MSPQSYSFVMNLHSIVSLVRFKMPIIFINILTYNIKKYIFWHLTFVIYKLKLIHFGLETKSQMNVSAFYDLNEMTILGLVTEYIRYWNKTKTGKYMTSLFKVCGYWEPVSLSWNQFLSLIQFIKNVYVDLWYVRTSASNYLNYTIKVLAFYMFLIRNFISYHCLNMVARLFM